MGLVWIGQKCATCTLESSGPGGPGRPGGAGRSVGPCGPGGQQEAGLGLEPDLEPRLHPSVGFLCHRDRCVMPARRLSTDCNTAKVPQESFSTHVPYIYASLSMPTPCRSTKLLSPPQRSSCHVILLSVLSSGGQARDCRYLADRRNRLLHRRDPHVGSWVSRDTDCLLLCCMTVWGMRARHQVAVWQ